MRARWPMFQFLAALGLLQQHYHPVSAWLRNWLLSAFIVARRRLHLIAFAGPCAFQDD